MNNIHRNSIPTASATAAKVKRVVIDFPESLYRAAESAAAELEINRSKLIRQAVKQYLKALQRRKLEKELAAGYIANAASARALANDMMGTEPFS